MDALAPVGAMTASWSATLRVTFEALLWLLDTGGPVLAVLASMSVLGAALLLVKMWQFHRAGLRQAAAVERLLARLEPSTVQEVRASARRLRHPAARALEYSIDLREKEAPAEARRLEVAERHAAALIHPLRSGQRPLEVIAALAPLLGLFGTVLGMIDAFRALEQAGPRIDPTLLSGGIWVALLTTAAGLAVAIPAVVAVNWLEARVEQAECQVGLALSAVFALPTGQAPARTGGPERTPCRITPDSAPGLALT